MIDFYSVKQIRISQIWQQNEYITNMTDSLTIHLLFEHHHDVLLTLLHHFELF